MSEQRLVELIHAEIDGELDAAGRAELSQLLLADPDARQLREQMVALCHQLDALPQEEAPPALSDSVLRVLDERGEFSRRARPAAQGWRYAAMFAGGLALGAAAFNLDRAQPPSTDFADLVGTMAQRTEHTDDGSQLQIDEKDLHGSVSLRAEGSLLMLEFDIQSPHPVRVVATHEGYEVAFNGSGYPREHFGLVIERRGTVSGNVHLSFYSDGAEVHQGLLTVPEVR